MALELFLFFLFLDPVSTVPGAVVSKRLININSFNPQQVYKVGTIVILTLQVEKLRCFAEGLRKKLPKVTELVRGVLAPLYYVASHLTNWWRYIAGLVI